MLSNTLILLLVVVVAFSTAIVRNLLAQTKKGKPQQQASKHLYVNELEPMPADFQWQEQEPEKYRPMKDAVYKMTMAIKNLNFNDYILFDKNYVERTNVRIKLSKEIPEETILYNEMASELVKEYYEFVIDFYLRRYPMIFSKKNEKEVFNSARNETLPLSSQGKEPLELMHLLARHMEDDFLILLKSEEEGEYVLRLANAIFPNGFSPLFNLNKKLSAIHQPVPQYESRLKLAMNRFFERVQPYQFVYRVNWGIQTHTKLFALTGNHGRQQEFQGVGKLDASKVDFNKVFLRSERQVLTRMPRTKALVFSLKTYCTPLTKIRDEGLSDVLVGAIEKLPEDVARYKNRPKWGEAVISYMRGETNGITDEKYDYKFVT